MTSRSALDTQMCFALYSASRAITARYRDLLAPLGLTYPQYLVMLVLWEEPSLAINELGRRLYLDSGTLSPLLKRLQVMGLVNRERSTDDERVVLVTLTDQGAKLQRGATHLPDAICAAMGLDEGELTDLRDRVESVADHVRATTHRTESDN